MPTSAHIGVIMSVRGNVGIAPYSYSLKISAMLLNSQFFSFLQSRRAKATVSLPTCRR